MSTKAKNGNGRASAEAAMPLEWQRLEWQRLERQLAKNPGLKLTEADQQTLVKRLDLIRAATADIERRLASLVKKPKRPADRLLKLSVMANTLYWYGYYTRLNFENLRVKYDCLERHAAARLEAPPLPSPEAAAILASFARLRARSGLPPRRD